MVTCRDVDGNERRSPGSGERFGSTSHGSAWNQESGGGRSQPPPLGLRSLHGVGMSGGWAAHGGQLEFTRARGVTELITGRTERMMQRWGADPISSQPEPLRRGSRCRLWCGRGRCGIGGGLGGGRSVPERRGAGRRLCMQRPALAGCTGTGVGMRGSTGSTCVCAGTGAGTGARLEQCELGAGRQAPACAGLGKGVAEVPPTPQLRSRWEAGACRAPCPHSRASLSPMHILNAPIPAAPTCATACASASPFPWLCATADACASA